MANLKPTRQDSYKHEYSMSQDFTNIEEPPLPQETPDVSELNLQDDAKKPTPFLRRRSTNYIDALESQLRSKLGVKSQEPTHNDRENNTSTMNAQVTQHDMQKGSVDMGNVDRSYSYNGADMGYHICPESSSSLHKAENIDRPRFQSKNLFKSEKNNPYGISFGKEEGRDSGNTSIAPEEEIPADLAHLKQRRPSVYEDFKKDVYERLHLFSK